MRDNKRKYYKCKRRGSNKKGSRHYNLKDDYFLYLDTRAKDDNRSIKRVEIKRERRKITTDKRDNNKHKPTRGEEIPRGGSFY